MTAPDDPEDHPGLARERTDLAWTRTAIAFAALGGVILKTSVAAGLTVLALSVLIWELRRLFPAPGATGGLHRRLRVVTAAVTVVSLVALLVALLGHPGFLR